MSCGAEQKLGSERVVDELTDMDSTRGAVGQLVQLVASYKVVYKVSCCRQHYIIQDYVCIINYSYIMIILYMLYVHMLGVCVCL